MPVKELLKVMLHSFFVIATGTVMAMFVSCLVLNPEAVFSVADIGGILLVALLSDLPFCVFLSRSELSKRQMAARFAIHILLVVILVLGFAWFWGWMDIEKPVEVALFVLLTLGVYAIVFAAARYRDRRTADRLNDELKKRYPS